MKQHPQYNHLKISETGEVFSTKSNKILKTFINKNGYEVFVTRLNGRNSKPLSLRVHRLVAETYIENIHNKPFVNHIDGIKLNNNKSNLEWVTSKENSVHAKENNLLRTKHGTEHTQSKLTESDVIFIRTHYTPRHKQYGARALATKYNVHHSIISNVYHNKSYKNI